MRLGAWRQILFANLTLAASLAATGCAGTAMRGKRADAPPRENLAPADYAQADEENRPEQSFDTPEPRVASHNKFDFEFQGDDQYGYSQSQDLAQAGQPNILERDLHFLRETQEHQEKRLWEMRSNPDINPEAIRQQEKILEETRQRINIYDLALSSQGQNSQPERMERMDMMPSPRPEMSRSAMLEREQIMAMGSPSGQTPPPRSEVRMPSMGGNGSSGRFDQAGQYGAMSGGAPRNTSRSFSPDPEQETERVVYDPRRDGDFSLFAFTNTAGDAATQPGDQMEQQAPEPQGGELRTIVPFGSIPPSMKASPPAPPAQKPFAGAPVGRPMNPPKKKIELPHDWAPPSDLFSPTSAPEEVRAHPGLYSPEDKTEQVDWPTRMPQSQSQQSKKAESPRTTQTVIKSTPEFKTSGNDPVRIEIEMKSTPTEKRTAPTEQRRSLRPEDVFEKPVVTKPTPRQNPQPAPAPKEEPAADEVFVPDLFFSR